MRVAVRALKSKRKKGRSVVRSAHKQQRMDHPKCRVSYLARAEESSKLEEDRTLRRKHGRSVRDLGKVGYVGEMRDIDESHIPEVTRKAITRHIDEHGVPCDDADLKAS